VYGFGKSTLGYGTMYAQLAGPKTTIGPANVVLSSQTTSVTGSCVDRPVPVRGRESRDEGPG
jgi:hypothetical protein